MKKIKYYEVLISKDGSKNFVPFEGYLHKLYHEETGQTVNIVTRQHEKGLWKSTHEATGLLIKFGYKTQKECRRRQKKLSQR